jgi:hypothetical protein
LISRYGPRIARAARLLRRPGTYASLARETLWTRTPWPLEPLPLSWPLEPSSLAGVSVTWPASSPWWGALRWLQTLRDGLAAHVPVSQGPVEQERVNMVVFELTVDGTAHRVAVDFDDGSEIDADVAVRVPVYFKLQHTADGYAQASVVPGGYVVAQASLYRYLGRLRALRDGNRPEYDVYGRFGAYGQPVRERVLDELTQQRRFRFRGSLGTVLYIESMQEVARSRICVDLPGRGSFCYRLADYLAVGACVVAVPHTNVLHVPLVDREHLVYAEKDGSGIVELCASLLGDEAAQAAYVSRSREFFDRYLEPRQLAAYYLTTALGRVR